MFSVAVWGANSPLGRRVITQLASDPEVLPRVVDVDVESAGGALDPACLAGCDALALLGGPAVDGEPGADGAGVGAVDLAAVRSLLRAATEAGVGAVVAVSSATVYGAWEGNPVPLTEEAPIRPPNGLLYVTSRAELERLVAAWRLEAPGGAAAILRPAATVDRDQRRSFARSVWGGRHRGAREADPPVQLLDLVDLAAAVELALRERLDGPFNVAPDGWLDPGAVRELVGSPAQLPSRFSRLLASGRHRDGSGVAPYLEHPWVAANDRLKAAGWVPTATTEELIVEMGRRRVWGPRTRQELSLVAAAGAVVAATAGVVALIAHRSARRKRRSG